MQSMKRGFYRLHHKAWLAGAVVLALSASALASAQRVVLGAPAGVAQAAQTDPAVRGTLQRLHAAALKTGQVRVMVGVRTPFAPEGRLAPEAVSQQRQDIAQTQAAVLARLPLAVQKKGPLHRFESIPFLALTVSSADLAALEQMPEVVSIQLDKPNRSLLSASVPFIGGSTAWASGYTGSGQTVAILDTGVAKEHPFLTGKVVSEACYSTTLVSDNSTSVCPGGAAQSTAADSGLPCVGDCDHGTHVAGIVAGNNGPADSAPDAPAGVAKLASLIAVQVFSDSRDPVYCKGSDHCPKAYDSDIVRGLERVLALRSTYRIAAVNVSAGSVRYTSSSACDAANASTKAAIDNLRAVGIATVVASGNGGSTDAMTAPACISSAISVGSTYAEVGHNNNCDGNNLGTSTLDSLSCYSNSASFLNLLAPGSAIDSSVPGNTYNKYWGTSMAAAHVAGAWAIIKHKRPAATVTEVLNALTTTGQSVTDPRNGVTKPRINVGQALNTISAVPVLFNASDFVAQQYRDFLGREVDANSLTSTVDQLHAGTISRAQLVQNLINSDESKGRYGPAVRLYTAYFLRHPDYAGLMYWLGRLYPANGAPSSLAEVSQAFAQSTEFMNRYGSLGNESFVDLVYQNVLGRPPEAAGRSYWVGQLNAGMSRGALMVGFSESTENKRLTANPMQITMGYIGLLRRTPDAAGHAYWLDGVVSGQRTLLAMIDQFLVSTEYAQRF